MTRIRDTQNGITLIEVVIAVTISSIIVLSLSGYLNSVIRFFRLSQIQFELQNSVRTSMNLMSRWLRMANRDSIQITELPGQPPYSRIVFTNPKGTFSFYQQNNKLYFSDLIAGTTKEIVSCVYRVSFLYPKTQSEDIISISLCCLRTSPRKMYSLRQQNLKLMN